MKTKKSEPVKTVLTICLGFLVLHMVFKWKWALSTSLIIGIMGLISNYLSEKIDFVWMKLTEVLSLIVPNIILGVLFYLFLFPIAIVSRIFSNKDPLRLGNREGSTFVSINKEFEKESFERPW